MRGSIALALVAALVAFAPVGAQNQWIEQVEVQLEAVMAEIGPDFDAVSDILIGELENADSDGFEMELLEGVEYLIVGVCDADCSDLDLAIYDENDDLVDADTEVDDVPVIRFVAHEDTVVWIEIGMAACNAATCAFGVQGYAR